MERVKGEQQELYEAIGRLIRLRAYQSGTAERPVEQVKVTIPKAIARLMRAKSSTWSWDITDEGVLLRPVDLVVTGSELPSWVQNGSS